MRLPKEQNRIEVFLAKTDDKYTIDPIYLEAELQLRYEINVILIRFLLGLDTVFTMVFTVRSGSGQSQPGTTTRVVRFRFLK